MREGVAIRAGLVQPEDARSASPEAVSPSRARAAREEASSPVSPSPRGPAGRTRSSRPCRPARSTRRRRGSGSRRRSGGARPGYTTASTGRPASRARPRQLHGRSRRGVQSSLPAGQDEERRGASAEASCAAHAGIEGDQRAQLHLRVLVLRCARPPAPSRPRGRSPWPRCGRGRPRPSILSLAAAAKTSAARSSGLSGRESPQTLSRPRPWKLSTHEGRVALATGATAPTRHVRRDAPAAVEEHTVGYGPCRSVCRGRR